MIIDEVIKCDRVEKKYGLMRKKMALDNIDLRVMNQEVVCLVGPNGAGKSTLLKIIGNIIKRYSGKVSKTANISYVPENSVLFPNMTGYENLEYYGKILGRTREQVISVMNSLGLENSKVLASNFSKGMKRKLDIARAMMVDSMVVLMDEPFDGLEPKICDQLTSYILDLKAKGRSFLISSHELSRVQTIADRIYFMDQGRIKSETNSNNNNYIYIEFEAGSIDLKNLKIKQIETVETEKNSALLRIDENMKPWVAIRQMIESGVKITSVSREPLESLYRRIYNNL